MSSYNYQVKYGDTKLFEDSQDSPVSVKYGDSVLFTQNPVDTVENTLDCKDTVFRDNIIIGSKILDCANLPAADDIDIITAFLADPSTQSITTTQTWYVPAGVHKIYICCVGGGGAGGGCWSSGNRSRWVGGGGGAGGKVIWNGWFDVIPGQPISISIGGQGGTTTVSFTDANGVLQSVSAAGGGNGTGGGTWDNYTPGGSGGSGGGSGNGSGSGYPSSGNGGTNGGNGGGTNPGGGQGTTTKPFGESSYNPYGGGGGGGTGSSHPSGAKAGGTYGGGRGATAIRNSSYSGNSQPATGGGANTGGGGGGGAHETHEEKTGYTNFNGANAGGGTGIAFIKCQG